jgi:uncharacterized protein
VSLHTVDDEGRYDGLTLSEALPRVVAEVVDAVQPVEVIVFGSVARSDDGPDSDIDLLVVLDEAPPETRRDTVRAIRAAITTFAPVDIVVCTRDELHEHRDDVGSAVYWPLREGRSVHRRADTDVT